jgi:peptidoglycan/LPS O-acetylase OafA/YrhL
MDTLFANGHGRLEDRDNIFTAMRMAFAMIVVYAHALQMLLPWPVAGAWAQAVDFAGQHALNAFFVFSGYMILASLRHSKSVLAYAINRAFRVFPLLIAVMGLVICVLGPVLSGMSPGAYLSQGAVWVFFAQVVSQADATAALPFSTLPIEANQSANAPLWTVRYEIIAYAGMGVLGLTGLLNRRWVLLAGLAGVTMVSALHGAQGYSGTMAEGVTAGIRFALGFLLGAALYDWRERMSLSWAQIGLAVLLAFALSPTPLGQAADILATALIAMRVGFLRADASRVWRAARDVEDYSYGIYIIHWPAGLLIMHVVIAQELAIGTTTMMALMTGVTLGIAIPLRHGIETPFQTLGRRVARGRQRAAAASTARMTRSTLPDHILPISASEYPRRISSQVTFRVSEASSQPSTPPPPSKSDTMPT